MLWRMLSPDDALASIAVESRRRLLVFITWVVLPVDSLESTGSLHPSTNDHWVLHWRLSQTILSNQYFSLLLGSNSLKLPELMTLMPLTRTDNQGIMKTKIDRKMYKLET